MDNKQNITTATDFPPLGELKGASRFPLLGGLRGAFLLATEAGNLFNLNPVVILAQAALETGWGSSNLARKYNNFFGMTAYGKPNDWWTGEFVMLATGTLKFRIYTTPRNSFMDYARLITSNYKPAAAMSYHPEAFAKEIAYSRYISEVNGDNREAYRKALIKICKQIGQAPLNPPEGGTPPTLARNSDSVPK